MFESLIKRSKEHKWELLIVGSILLLGIFFRTYNFSDWLLFEIDQTYDTRIVSQAIDNGIGELPLLGPTAGGGRALRLGPAFYNLEYVSAFIFGNTPTGHAMLVLLFSILSLPLFYLFSRRYFDKNLSLALLSLFTCSVYLVLYGRFSWSPNVLPFLILLGFYTLLRSVSVLETKRDRYFLLATVAITIASQIHFNAFFTLPTITVLFLLYKRPRFSYKTWVLALAIIALVYSPMVVNDIVTNGENISLFIKKVAKGGSASPFSDVVRKTVVDLQYTASNYFFINSGIDRINGGRLKEYGFQSNANLPWRLLALILFLAELVYLFRKIPKEGIPERRDFLVLLALWVLVSFTYFYSLISSNFQIYPRFFLLVAPAAILLFGILLETMTSEKNKYRLSTFITILSLLLIPNLVRITTHFFQLAYPAESRTEVETEDIFPNNKRLTLSEQLAITDYLVEKQQQNGYPIYFDAIHEYEPVFWYHLNRRGVSYHSNIDESFLYDNGNYFRIKFSESGSVGQAFRDSFDVSDEKDFGILTVYTLEPKSEKIKALKQDPTTKQSLEQTEQIQALRTWNDL